MPNTEEKELEEYLLQANKVGYENTRCQVKMIAENVIIDKGVRCEVLRSVMDGGIDFYDILTSRVEVGIVLVI